MSKENQIDGVTYYFFDGIKDPKREERKAKMIEMRNNGFNYSEIGKAFAISKQRVYSIIGGELKGHFKEITSEQCIYPILRKWMNDNRISRMELCRRVFGDIHAGHGNRVRCFLKGQNEGIQKNTIDKYLNATGLTYEELFEMKGGAE